MRMNIIPVLLAIAAALVAVLSAPEAGAVSLKITYQGGATVGGDPFTGTGYFKTALTDSTGTATYWSNDGTSVDGSEPTAAISTEVDAGSFAFILGDTTITNMTALTEDIFTGRDEIYLKAWFNDGTSGFELLSPMLELTSSPFALNCNALQGYAASDFILSSSQITGSQIASGAVGSTQIATSAVGSSQIADSSVTQAKIGTGVLGTMAVQNAAAVSISGGAIDGATVGSTTPAAITATTLGASGLLSADGGIAVDTNKFTVADGTGVTTIAGSLAADGGISVDTNKFTVAGDNTGNTAVVGTFDVDGATTLDQVTIATADGAFSVSGTGNISLLSDSNDANALSITSNTGSGAATVNIQATNGGITLSTGADGKGTTLGPLLSNTPDTVTSSAVAINLNKLVTYINSQGAGAQWNPTIADGANGQIKYLVMINAGAPVSAVINGNINGTSLTFDAAGEGATLVFDTTTAKWSVVGSTATYVP